MAREQPKVDDAQVLAEAHSSAYVPRHAWACALALISWLRVLSLLVVRKTQLSQCRR